MSVTSLPKDVLNGMTDKESLRMGWRQWTHIANIKNALQVERLNTCNVDVNGLCLVPSTVLLHSLAASVRWNAHILLCAEIVTTG